MKKNKLTSLMLLFALSLALLSNLYTNKANALNGNNFNAGNIIDDTVFFNKNSMTVQQIQDFLNSKVSVCNTNQQGYTGSSGTVYNPPWVCLKDYYENTTTSYSVSFNYLDANGATQTDSRTYYQNNAYTYTALSPVYVNGDYRQGLDHLVATINSVGGVVPSGAVSAAQIIYDASQLYGINPQVLLVTLQKEQGLITDTAPQSWQYQSALGYGCPDYMPCSGVYAGFSKQIYSAAWQFKQYELKPDQFNFKAGVTRYIQYNPDGSCGGSNVFLQNQATANLYNYTPYQPNPATLNVAMGQTVNCGAYGNINFYQYFTNWFGSVRELYKYNFETLVGPNGAIVTADINTDNVQSLTIDNSMYVFYNNKTSNTIEYVLYKDNVWSRHIIDGPLSSSIGSVKTPINISSIISFNYLGQPQLFYIDSTNQTVRHGFISGGVFHIETLDGATNSVIKSNRQLGSAISGFDFNNGQIQLYYYDIGNNSLIHTWWNGRLWGSETLDGATNSVIKSNRQLGSAISGFDFNNGQIQLYYYDIGNNSLIHTWWNGRLWGSETLDGATNSVIKSNRQLGSAISGFDFNNGQIQLYYYEKTNGELIHTWFNNGWSTEIMDGTSDSLFSNTINSGKRIDAQLLNNSVFIIYYDDALGFIGERTSSWRIAYINNSWISNTLDGGVSSKTSSTNSIPISTPSSTQYNGSIQIFYADSNNNLRHVWMNK